jgi:polyisoprenoid-binding protein YceI
MKYLLLLLTILCTSIFAGEYHVVKSAENMVKFVSDAPIEDFEGVTSSIDGYLFWEGEDFLNQSELYFEVDLNTVDTGIGLRNRHMRENYLHTDEFPKTHYTAKLIKADSINETEYEVEAEGTFFVHGVEKQKKITGKLLKIDNDKYKVSANFKVALSDYNIEVPSIMFYKIDENMDLCVEFYLKKAPASEEKSD